VHATTRHDDDATTTRPPPCSEDNRTTMTTTYETTAEPATGTMRTMSVTGEDVLARLRPRRGNARCALQAALGGDQPPSQASNARPVAHPFEPYAAACLPVNPQGQGASASQLRLCRGIHTWRSFVPREIWSFPRAPIRSGGCASQDEITQYSTKNPNKQDLAVSSVASLAPATAAQPVQVRTGTAISPSAGRGSLDDRPRQGRLGSCRRAVCVRRLCTHPFCLLIRLGANNAS
jgi:hypothetical protein